MQRLYLAPLDGLRFFAFLAVFIHHLPKFSTSPALVTANTYGWVGVELFFLISSYLFFHLLDAEFVKTGTISAGRFFTRRMLRIYPLMVIFPAAMLAVYGSSDGLGLARLAGLALFQDNLIIWFLGYNVSIPNTAHLWTLSFEFQIYLLIPFTFLAYRKFGRRVFLAALATVFVYCFIARATVFSLGGKHPIIWVTPFLRPETVLLGMALYVVRPAWHWSYSLALAIAAGVAFLSLPPPFATPLSSALSYPLAALMCGGLVDAGLRMPLLSHFLSSAVLRYLGQISFGLYVFHFFGISVATRWVGGFGHGIDPATVAGDYWTLFAAALLLTIALATVSYFAFERWIFRIKQRFAVIEGRPAIA